MTREELLRQIAETGYNVRYAAKKHFATFEAVDKGPGWIGFISLAIGVYALSCPSLTQNAISAALIVSSVGALYMSFYDKSQYEIAGKNLTHSFQELRTLYASVKSLPAGADVTSQVADYSQLRTEANKLGISRQIFLSDWSAHYKFFWQMQIGWIDEQLQFKFWRDRMPLSLIIVLALGAVSGVGYLLSILNANVFK